MTKSLRTLGAVFALSIAMAAVIASPASAHRGKPTVPCYSYTAGDTQHKVKPNSCALVVSLRGCDGACAADQIYIDNCAWKRWAPRHARGHCTERANGGYHKRLGVKFRRVRHGRFTRGRIGGHKVHLPSGHSAKGAKGVYWVNADFSGNSSAPKMRPRRVYVYRDFATHAIHWRHWGAKSTVAKGRIHYDDCKPDCGAGRYRKAPGHITLSHIHHCGNRLQYRKVHLQFSNKPHIWDFSQRFNCDGRIG